MADPLAPIVQKMLDQVMSMINTPGNPYYFPTWIVANGYDPYGKDKVMQWSLALTDPNIIEQANAICPTIDIRSSPCAGDDTYIGAPNDNPHLTLGGPNPGELVVTGCVNSVMSSMKCDPNNAYNIQALMLLSTLPNFAKSVVINGDFTFTQYCCCSADGTTCSGPKQPAVGTGTFAATFVSAPTITINFKITALSPGVLNIAVSNILFSVANGPKGSPNISVTIEIKSIPKMQNQQAYNNLAMTAFNSPDGLKQLVQQINAVMNDASQLSFMSTALTKVIDGYLRDNHQYPFDGSHLAVF